MPLTDTHLVLLSAASQRDDGLLTRPDRLGGIALHKLWGFLLKADLAVDVIVRTDQPHWTKADDDVWHGLRITAAGLKAIGVDPSAAGEQTMDILGPVSTTESADGLDDASNPDEPFVSPVISTKPPRTGTKIARLEARLAEDDGVTIDALVIALRWRPHAIRAALTRLRQSGIYITTAGDNDGRTVYRSSSEQNRIETQSSPDAKVA